MTCPICEKKADPRYQPFCSKRCADVDLGKWLTGAYAIPSADENEFGELEQAIKEKANKPH